MLVDEFYGREGERERGGEREGARHQTDCRQGEYASVLDTRVYERAGACAVRNLGGWKQNDRRLGVFFSFFSSYSSLQTLVQEDIDDDVFAMASKCRSILAPRTAVVGVGGSAVPIKTSSRLKSQPAAL